MITCLYLRRTVESPQQRCLKFPKTQTLARNMRLAAPTEFRRSNSIAFRSSIANPYRDIPPT